MSFIEAITIGRRIGEGLAAVCREAESFVAVRRFIVRGVVLGRSGSEGVRRVYVVVWPKGPLLHDSRRATDGL